LIVIIAFGSHAPVAVAQLWSVAIDIMSSKVIASFVTRTPMEPKPDKETMLKITRFISQNRRITTLKEIADHLKQTEDETKGYMDGTQKHIPQLKHISQDNTNGYYFTNSETT
jgi:hypothetical protein